MHTNIVFANDIFMATSDDLKEFDHLLSQENKNLPPDSSQNKNKENRKDNSKKNLTDDHKDPRGQFQDQNKGDRRFPRTNPFNQRPPPGATAPGSNTLPPPPPPPRSNPPPPP